MLHPRLVFATITGLFALALAAFALARNPRRRLNRAFALFNVGFGLSFLNGYAFLIPSPDWATAVYRLLYVSIFLMLYFMLVFLQELAGGFGTPSARSRRRLMGGILAAMAVFTQTPWVFVGFRVDPATANVVFPVPGPGYPVAQGLLVGALAYLALVLFAHLRRASGIRQQQLRFLALAAILGILGVLARAFAIFGTDRPWLYFVPWLAVPFCFAYVISRHQLFEFGFWMRRFAIYAGVYSVLLGLPFLLFSVRGVVSAFDRWTAPLFVAAYGLLFSLAPSIASFFRERAERHRWNELSHQLDVLRASAEKLSEGGVRSSASLARHAVDMLKDLYWTRMKNPLEFVLVGLREPGCVVPSIYPSHDVDQPILERFFDALDKAPALVTSGAFSRMDVEAFFKDAADAPHALIVVRDYLLLNGIEFCLPCVHDGRLVGAILVGPKARGVFWSLELNTLSLAAAHLAAAVQKRDLLARERELEDLDQMKKTLISNITHEFKSPLAVVETALDLLIGDRARVEMTPARQTELLLMIRFHAGRLGSFVRDLLDIARLERSRVDLRRDLTDISALTRDVVAALSPLAEKKGLALRVAAPDGCMIAVDAEKIRQVVYNLVQNAVKFTPIGTVTIDVDDRDDRLRIVVADPGPGIDPRYREAIFEAFFRAPDVLKEKVEGSGLGLAIARGWAERHGGRLWAESEGDGRGSRFILEMPKNEVSESAVDENRETRRAG